VLLPTTQNQAKHKKSENSPQIPTRKTTKNLLYSYYKPIIPSKTQQKLYYTNPKHLQIPENTQTAKILPKSPKITKPQKHQNNTKNTKHRRAPKNQQP